jgi:hypothetical protein
MAICVAGQDYGGSLEPFKDVLIEAVEECIPKAVSFRGRPRKSMEKDLGSLLVKLLCLSFRAHVTMCKGSCSHGKQGPVVH